MKKILLILPFLFSICLAQPTTQTADYMIQKIGSNIFAYPKPNSGLPLYKGTDEGTVINNAITALTPVGCASCGGGYIKIMDSSFVLTTEITITGWTSGSTPSSQLIIEGRSTSTQIVQNTSGKNAIVIKNGASVVLRNFYFNIGASANSAILMDSTGANTKMSCYDCKLDNIVAISNSTGSPTMLLRNFYYLDAPYIYINALSNSALVLQNTQGSNNYGNSHFGLLTLNGSGSSPFASLVIQRNGGGALDHLQFDNVGMYNSYYGLYTDYAAYCNFDQVDVEQVANPIYIGATGNLSSAYTVGFTIQSGFFVSDSTIYTGIKVGPNSYRNTFKDITFEGGSSSIVPISDSSINQEPNSYYDMSFDGADYSPNIYIRNASTTPLTYKIYTGTIKQVLPNGAIATTQSAGNNSTLVATTAFVKSAIGASFTRQVITSGTSATGSAVTTTLIVTFDPASALSPFTFTMPAAPIDGQIVEFDFGTQIASGTVVPLTVSPNAGQSINDNTPPNGANMTPDNFLSYRYRLSNTTWYRRKP